MANDVRARLDAHLKAWLGEWPPSAPVVVTTSPARTTPGWDGHLLAFVGLRTPAGTVVSVAPDALDDAQSAIRARRVAEVVFRWCESPPDSGGDDGDIGEWVAADDGRLPDWLRPFGGEVLVAFDDEGAYAAGVGLKRHDELAWEISVGTEPAQRGKGLARRLVVQAARRVIAEGRVPTYLHDPANVASARVADAAGFPDEGWRLLVLRGGDPAAS